MPLERSAAYWSRWDELYTGEFEDRPAGLAGAVTSRAAAQVLRLSVIFALADQTVTLDVPHLAAAVAVWRYCQASAVAVFGTATGNRDADRFLAELAKGPLSRKDLSVLFSRHKSRRQLDEIVDAAKAMADISEYPAVTGGRPCLVYALTVPALAATAAAATATTAKNKEE